MSGLHAAIVLSTIIGGVCLVLVTIIICETLKNRRIHVSQTVHRKSVDQITDEDLDALTKDVKRMAADARRMGSEAADGIEGFADMLKDMKSKKGS